MSKDLQSLLANALGPLNQGVKKPIDESGILDDLPAAEKQEVEARVDTDLRDFAKTLTGKTASDQFAEIQQKKEELLAKMEARGPTRTETIMGAFLNGLTGLAAVAGGQTDTETGIKMAQNATNAFLNRGIRERAKREELDKLRLSLLDSEGKMVERRAFEGAKHEDTQAFTDEQSRLAFDRAKELKLLEHSLARGLKLDEANIERLNALKKERREGIEKVKGKIKDPSPDQKKKLEAMGKFDGELPKVRAIIRVLGRKNGPVSDDTRARIKKEYGIDDIPKNMKTNQVATKVIARAFGKLFENRLSDKDVEDYRGQTSLVRKFLTFALGKGTGDVPKATPQEYAELLDGLEQVYKQELVHSTHKINRAAYQEVVTGRWPLSERDVTNLVFTSFGLEPPFKQSRNAGGNDRSKQSDSSDKPKQSKNTKAELPPQSKIDAALKWANDNPDHPDAKKIIERLGAINAKK